MRFLLAIIFFLTPRAFGIDFEVAAENICPICSVAVKQILDGERLFPPATNENKRVAVVIAFGNSLIDMESSAINHIANDVVATDLGLKLVRKSIESGVISYHLFYQVGIDENGLTSLHNADSAPIYVMDRKDPHELWGFFQSIDGQGVVYLNEYQRPHNATVTLVHELTHLFDDKTRIYIEQQRATGEWSDLDELAMEFRAVAAESAYYAQRVRKHVDPFTEKSDLHRKFLNRSGGVDYESVAKSVLDMMYPETQGPAYELAAVGGDPEQNDILAFLSDFLGGALKKCQTGACPPLAVAKLEYTKASSQNYIDDRRQIQLDLTARGFSSLVSYFQSRGLCDDTFVLRATGINEYLYQTGGPSPRVGGGTGAHRRRIPDRAPPPRGSSPKSPQDLMKILQPSKPEDSRPDSN